MHQTCRASPDRIASLPGLGPASQLMPARAGITTVDQLRALGSVRAYAKTKAVNPQASLNLLWALEGALTGLPWQQVAQDHCTSLLLALDTYVDSCPSNPDRSDTPSRL